MSNTCITFDEYLKRNIVNKGEDYTHTRIGSKEQKISGGLYQIKDIQSFMDKYYQHVFVHKKKEYLTEKQKMEDAPLAIDIDMRYSKEIKKKQHTKEHIIDAINLYVKNINTVFDIPPNFELEIYVMEKPDVNILENKTKDGIHIIFGLLMHRAVQIYLREKVLSELKEIWEDLPLTNTVDELIDEGVTRGNVGWQMYGSRKPNNQAYLLKYSFNVCWNQDDDSWILNENNVEKFEIKKQIHTHA